MLMLAARLREHSSLHSKAAIRRHISAVREHNDSRATPIPVLCFPQRKPRKRTCYTVPHEYRKPTDANNTPPRARRFYLRPRLLCRLELWGLLKFSRFAVPQCPALESSPPDSPSLWSPHKSSTKQMASSASILSCRCCSCSCLQPLLKVVGGIGTRDMCA